MAFSEPSKSIVGLIFQAVLVFILIITVVYIGYKMKNSSGDIMDKIIRRMESIISSFS